MTYKAPGKHFRKGVSVPQFFHMFPDDKTAEEWFVEKRWPDGVTCPHCHSDNVQTNAAHKSMPYRCRDKSCAKRFSVKTGTVMQSSKLGYQTWLLAIYLISTNLKSISSMKLHRDLDVTQKTAWHLAHRIRQGWNPNGKRSFSGPVEVDETFMGGKRKNMSNAKRKILTGRGPVGKIAVLGIKDRDTNEVAAKVVDDTQIHTVTDFVTKNTKPGAKVYTDDALSYGWLLNRESVRHSAKEFVRGDVSTQGIESFWSMLKRAHMGTFHQLSARHLHRYVGEFSGRHNMREFDTLDQMEIVADRMVGKRLRYKELIA